jgi:hypothetical protein
MGYRAGVLQSSDMGVGVYHRLGFQQYGSSGIFVWAGVEKGNTDCVV